MPLVADQGAAADRSMPRYSTIASRWPLLLLLLPLLCLPGVAAISKKDAGLHDWTIPLIGQPSTAVDARPRFHYPAGPSKTSTSALIYTTTERNVLAAIEPRAGGIGTVQPTSGSACWAVPLRIAFCSMETRLSGRQAAPKVRAERRLSVKRRGYNTASKQ